jgi:pimeloyl-ACP methyl ester carboxylesterase
VMPTAVHVGGVGGALTRGSDARPLGSSPRGRVVLGALGGVWGDRLVARGSVLATPVAMIVDGRRPPTPRIAVFVHGLGETELAWRRPGYGEALAAGHGVTPVYARYNSGLAVEAGGRALAGALTAMITQWPVAVDEITLVGHSMGGLVIRAACHHGRGEPWSDRVRRTVGLGVPHEGAPLARAAATAERVLSALPETRPFAAILRVRSRGILDLEHGLGLPFSPAADHLFVSASVTRDPRAPAGRLLGDLLVYRSSAWAQRTHAERVVLHPGHYRHLGGVDHFDLLGHPAVVQRLEDWIAGDERPSAAVALAAELELLGERAARRW